jgi:hypothetical protein
VKDLANATPGQKIGTATVLSTTRVNLPGAMKQIAATGPKPKEEKAIPKDRYRSGAERKYAQTLETMRLAGSIKGWAFEAVTLVVADDGKNRVRYTPDFLVWTLDGGFYFVEIKGSNRKLKNAGRSKAIMARMLFPWTFTILRYEAGEFTEILRTPT